jgi:hypothetical protein
LRGLEALPVAFGTTSQPSLFGLEVQGASEIAKQDKSLPA